MIIIILFNNTNFLKNYNQAKYVTETKENKNEVNNKWNNYEELNWAIVIIIEII